MRFCSVSKLFPSGFSRARSSSLTPGVLLTDFSLSAF